MMTLRDLVKGKIGIAINSQKDLDTFLKIASRKRWHWIEGQSTYGYTPITFRECPNSECVVLVEKSNITKKAVMTLLPAVWVSKNKVKSLDWFVENFTSKTKLKGVDLGLGYAMYTPGKDTTVEKMVKAILKLSR